ncbi:MAG: carboxy terminal-processing peptidase [Saprospiraceae bacterium]|nr:carboxy terminal-processing peptidase [Saprospiraceae bacterium]
MIYKSSLVVALILGFLGLRSMEPKISGGDKESLIISAMLEYVEQVHFSPKPIDDDLSRFVFKTYLERVDAGKRYFTQQDIDLLKTQELIIDDQVRNRTFDFFNLSLDLLDKRMLNAEQYYNELIDQPFDLVEGKMIELDEEKKPYARDEAQLKQYWKDFLTYEIISRVDRKLDEQAESKETAKSETELVEEARKDIKKTFGDWFNRLKKQRRSDRFEVYVGSITNYFDPHTDFYNPKEKQDFDIIMGGKLEGIGARLQQDGDYIKVTDIVTGGPAWKGKELEANDLILSAAQEGKEAVDLTGMRVDDAVTHIRGKKGTKVMLTVKKQDGTVRQITIMRDEVILDESFARSVIFDMPGVINNIGYIKLPKFYSSFEKEDGNSCAVDVAKEIEKLKENKVNGIILDLRNNTGGSLNDVVDMSGFFIEQGPIVQVKSRQAKPYLHMDRDSRVQYDGPLIIMVNSMSASASEIIAAAMQDYGRAVIVGSKSTFGKGSVQRFFDLDKAVAGSEELKPLGEIKMTVQKFYRVNGGSNQLKGVIPDVILPDNYMFIDVGEKEYENAMEWTEIAAQSYAQQVVKIENLNSIAAKSKKRVKADQRFISVEENALRLKQNRDNSQVSLSLKDYRAQMKKLEDEAGKFDKLFKSELEGFAIKNLPQDLDGLKADESKKARNDDWFKEMKKDFYLTETMNVMKDMITGEKSFGYLVEKIK